MSEFDNRMEQLRARFRIRAAGERVLLADALRALDKAEIRRLAHGLSGTGGVFGYPDVSRDAHMLEEAVDAGEPTERIQALGAALLASLDGAVQPD